MSKLTLRQKQADAARAATWRLWTSNAPNPTYSVWGGMRLNSTAPTIDTARVKHPNAVKRAERLRDDLHGQIARYHRTTTARPLPAPFADRSAKRNGGTG